MPDDYTRVFCEAKNSNDYSVCLLSFSLKQTTVYLLGYSTSRRWLVPELSYCCCKLGNKIYTCGIYSCAWVFTILYHCAAKFLCNFTEITFQQISKKQIMTNEFHSTRRHCFLLFSAISLSILIAFYITFVLWSKSKNKLCCLFWTPALIRDGPLGAPAFPKLAYCMDAIVCPGVSIREGK